jgi:hypothetical protein
MHGILKKKNNRNLTTMPASSQHSPASRCGSCMGTADRCNNCRWTCSCGFQGVSKRQYRNHLQSNEKNKPKTKTQEKLQSDEYITKCLKKVLRCLTFFLLFSQFI